MYNQLMHVEGKDFLHHRLSRRALGGIVVGAILAERSGALPARAEDDTALMTYATFLENTFVGINSPEGAFAGSFSLTEVADIAYGFALTELKALDEFEVDFGRDTFSLTTTDNVLRAVGKVSAAKDTRIGDVPVGGVTFDVSFTSDPSGKLMVNDDEMEIDGTGSLSVFDLEEKARKRIGEDPNATFAKLLNNAYKERFHVQQALIGDVNIYLSNDFIDIVLARAEPEIAEGTL